MNSLFPFTMVTSRSQLETVLGTLLAQPAIAVDTESNSLYAYHEQICLIQFSIPDSDILVDPLADLDLSPLGELFANPAIQKVFHAAEQDLAGMKRDFEFQFANLFDTMWTARILGWPKVGLGDVLQENFGVHTNKQYQRHNWGKRPIIPRALDYARLDTHYLLPLRDLQLESLERVNRVEEATEVFDQIAQTPPASLPFGPDAFWRVKGVYDLEEKHQAVLWELYCWRDRVASKRNRPPFKIVSNKVLLTLACDWPDRPEDLLQVRGLKPYHVRRYGQAILKAVHRGKNGPAPRPPSHPRRRRQVRERYQALRTWRKERANRRRVDSDVILSNTVLWALAEQPPTTLQELAQIEELGPWKRKTYGPAILKVLGNSK